MDDFPVPERAPSQPADRHPADELLAARTLELGRLVAAALEPRPMAVEDLYDERGLPT
jgi:hypothetical protein